MDDLKAPAQGIGLGQRIEHDLLPGFTMKVQAITECEVDAARPEPHPKYQITDPEGQTDWLCAYEVHALG